MSDVFAVADLLIDDLKKNHCDEVDLVAYYGSHAQGVASEHSDLDFFYVPAAGCDPPIARCFLLDGRLFDFWPLSWQTLEGFATGTLRNWAFAPALVYHAKVLYARSDEMAGRLAGLKDQVDSLQKDAARPQMLRRALGKFVEVQAHMAELRQAQHEGHLVSIRCVSWQIVEGVWECLALANQVFFNQGLHKSLAKVQHFEHRPADMEKRIEIIATSPVGAEIAASSEVLVGDTRQLLVALQESLPATSINEGFYGAYPELKDAMGKVVSACRAGERVAAVAAAWSVQRELDGLLAATLYGVADMDFNRRSEVGAAYRALALPELLVGDSLDLGVLEVAVESLDERLRSVLVDRGVALNEFADMSELERDL